MDPEHLSKLCDAFGLGTPLSIEEDHEGVLNRNFDLQTDTGRYFIKSVRDRRKDAIPIIAAAESFMAEGGIPAVCMLRTKSGDLFLPHGGEVYTTYPYMPHVQPAEAPYATLGEMLGRIHLRGSDSVPDELQSIRMTEKDLSRVQGKLAEYRERTAKGTHAADALMRTYIDTKLEQLQALPAVSAASLTLVHGDYHARNILFDAHASIVGICDWEKAELAPRAYEIARSVQYICFEGREAPYEYDRRAAVLGARQFLDAYRTAYPIESEELRNGFSLRLRKLVMSFWIEERFYDHGDDRANKFIENETRLIADFSQPGLVEELIA